MVHRTTESASASNGHPAVEGVAPLDLQPFCGTDEYRDYLMKPFCFAGYTWATNGHILVRVPLDDCHPTLTAKIDPSRVLEKLSTVTLWAKLQGTYAPPRDPIICDCCDGSGRDNENEEFACFFCGGRGKGDAEAKISTTVLGVPYALNYIRQVLSLPDVEIAPNVASNEAHNYSPLLFRFSGGIGALMPLRCKFDDHVDMDPLPTDFSAAEASAVSS